MTEQKQKKLTEREKEMVKGLEKGKQTDLHVLLKARANTANSANYELGRGMIAALADMGVVVAPAKGK